MMINKYNLKGNSINALSVSGQILAGEESVNRSSSFFTGTTSKDHLKPWVNNLQLTYLYVVNAILFFTSDMFEVLVM